MCLTVDKELTEEVKDKFVDGKMICWKWLVADEDEVTTPYAGVAIQGGEFVASDEDIASDYYIDVGAIHVFLSKEAACDDAGLEEIDDRTTQIEFFHSDNIDDPSNTVIIPVLCREEDFIAAGDFTATLTSACFKKVFYPLNIESVIRSEVSFSIEPTWEK